MKKILEEIHDRSLWQVLGLYLGMSWLVLQVVQTMAEGLSLPDWVVPLAVILLLIGLPVVLATAFLQRGFRKREAEPGPQSPADVDEVPSAPLIPRSGAARILTWKRALLGGLAAAVMVVAAAGGWAFMRSAGIGPAGTLVAKGVLDERETILLADFENGTDDPTLAGVVTEALRVDLSQSEAVRLASPGYLAGALSRMALPPDTRMRLDVAREIGQREGLKALVTGSVARAGAGYSLTARVETPGTGEILVSHRETAGDSTELLDAIEALSKRLRERIGEPLGALAATPPLAEVTTSNLEALRKFTEATRLPDADAERTIQLLEEAVALDTSFAMAWRALGITLQNFGREPGRAMEAATKAFEQRDHLTEAESDAVEAMYYMNVTGDPRRAVPVFESAIERDPEAVAPTVNIGEAYRLAGDLETAIQWYERALALDSTQSIALMNIAQVSSTRGDFERSFATADLLDAYGHRPFGDWHRAAAHAARRDMEAAEEAMRDAREEARGSPFLLANTNHWLAAMVAIRGRLEEADALLGEVAALQEQREVPVEVLRIAAYRATVVGLARGGEDVALLDEGLEAHPLEDLDPVVRPYLELADAYAQLGRPGRAAELVEAFDATAPEAFARGQRYLRQQAIGSIALAEGRHDEAVAAFRQSSSRPQEILPLVLLARAFDAAGRPDSARVYYGRYLDSTYWLRTLWDPMYLAPALERAAELEEQAGDLQAAVGHWAELVELWSEADPELQPRVARAQERLQELYDRIG